VDIFSFLIENKNQGANKETRRKAQTDIKRNNSFTILHVLFVFVFNFLILLCKNYSTFFFISHSIQFRKRIFL